MEQGERNFSFKFMAGTEDSLLKILPRLAQAFNEPPYALSLTPRGSGRKPGSFMALTGDETVTCAALFKSGKDNVLRLHNQSASPAAAVVKLSDCEKLLSFKKFEVKTLVLHQGELKESRKLRI
jgi:hypothetical protein